MPPTKTKTKSFFQLLGFLLVCAIGAAAIFSIMYRQSIVDMVRAQQFVPSKAVAAIRDDLDFTDQGKLLFNASQPQLEKSTQFNDSCGQHQETNNPILGCYYAQRIYIYDVQNKTLDGIEETTAAHEFLHAVYERLSDSDREAIDAEIKKVLRTVETPDLRERMKYYEKTEPGEQYNELYAILGTEFQTLSPVLEKSYAQYFTSRAKLVNYYKKYNAVFESVTEKLKSQLTTINALTKQTNAAISSYDKRRKQLDADIQKFNANAANGGYRTQSQFETDRNVLSARKSALDSERNRLLSSIKHIKKLTKQRNALVDKYNALNSSINSSLEPTPKL